MAVTKKTITLTVTITGSKRAASQALAELLSNCSYDHLPVTVVARDDEGRVIASYSR